MKAIVKVHKLSSYAKYNYLTFDVKEVVSRNLIALNVNESTVDFSFKEVIIVDLQKEALKAFEMDEPKLFDFLNQYAHYNGQSFKIIQQVTVLPN